MSKNKSLKLYSSVRKSENIRCPECKAPVSQLEVKDILGEEVIEDLEKLA